MSTQAAIGIGSNLGDRRACMQSAVAMLDGTSGVAVVACSDLIETAPVGGPEQGPFLNGALLVDCELDCDALLERLHAIERAHGRTRPDAVRWGPRTLDLDLLLFGSLVRAEPPPVLPHPRMHERSFVLEPLASIAPGMQHPVLGRSIEELHEAIRDPGLECR